MINALRTALSTLGHLAPLGSPENTGQRYRIEFERDAAMRSDVIVVSSRFDHNGQRPEVYAKEEVPDIISEDSDQHEAMVLAAAMRLLVAVAGTTALVKAGVIEWTGKPINALAGYDDGARPVYQSFRITPPRDAYEVTRTTVNDLMNGSAIRPYFAREIVDAVAAKKHDSAAWSASLRTKLAASEVLRGPTIACQGDWDDE